MHVSVKKFPFYDDFLARGEASSEGREKEQEILKEHLEENVSKARPSQES